MLYQRAPYSISQGAALQYHVSYDASPFFPLRVLASPFSFPPLAVDGLLQNRVYDESTAATDRHDPHDHEPNGEP